MVNRLVAICPVCGRKIMLHELNISPKMLENVTHYPFEVSCICRGNPNRNGGGTRNTEDNLHKLKLYLDYHLNVRGIYPGEEIEIAG